MIEKAQPQFYDVTLRDILDFGNETRHFDFAFGPGEGMNFTPGQFVAVLCPKDGGMVRRAYSVASPPEEKEHIGLVLKRVEGGVVTNWFWGLKAGQTIRVHGPFGKFILPEKIDFHSIFVATGTGIAPFRSMIRSVLTRGHAGTISLIFGVRYDNTIPYHPEWLKLAGAHPNFTYIPTISRPGPDWKGETGYVQTKIEKFFPDPAGKRVYICGLNEMIQAVQETCFKLGYQKDQVSFEKYD